MSVPNTRAHEAHAQAKLLCMCSRVRGHVHLLLAVAAPRFEFQGNVHFHLNGIQKKNPPDP